MFWSFPLVIQAHDSQSDSWYEKKFMTKKEFVDFMQAQFKLPGKYNITLAQAKKMQEEGLHYSKTAKGANFQGGRYHNFVKNSSQHKKWKETQKDRILNGVIYDDLYIPPFLYWYINYCPIYNDLKKRTMLADVWDTDIWYFHYCMLCLLKGKHIGGVKGRQKGFSFKHMAILYWSYCWKEGSINTIGAYTEDLVQKSWRFLETYRNHINTYTTWKRGPIRPRALEWYERIERTDGTFAGINSKLVGVTFKQSPTADVGGNQVFFNYEEPGVSPTIMETLEFLKPAMEKGSVTTGTIIANGSVGKLEDADGLKTIFYHPADNNFLGIPNIWDEDAGPEDRCCIFISEAYSMIGEDYDYDENGEIIGGTGESFIDEAGNSRVELALAWIDRAKARLKTSSKKKELKQIAESQKCTSPKQAFAERKSSYYPVEALRRRQEQIKILDEENRWTTKPLKGLLYIHDGEVKLDDKDMGPEHGYPIKPEWEDKRGCITIYKWPSSKPKPFTFFAGVDTVEADSTTTSESIQSVDIFEGTTIVNDENGKFLRIEGDKLVATWRGRFNPVDKGNEQAWYLIKLYNAYCNQERSKPNFQNYMMRNGLAETYLCKESELQFYKDVNFYINRDSSKYGFVITDNNEMWRLMKRLISEYLFKEFGQETRENEKGEQVFVRSITGIDRIDDYWLLEELIQYVEDSSGRPKKNTDRLISFGAALMLSMVYSQNNISVRVEPSANYKPKEKVYSPKARNIIGNVRRNGYNRPRSII